MVLRDHQIEVINKTREALIAGFKRPLIFAPCSFGKTIVAAEISRMAVEKGKKVLFLLHRRLLATQTKEKFDAYGLHSSIIMAEYETDMTAKVMITTVQTYSRRLKLTNEAFNKFFHEADLIFCDEAHLGISKTFTDIYTFYENKPIIGLTGSPARGDGRGLGEVFDTIVESACIQELTEKKFLSPVRYFAGKSPNLKGVTTQLGDFNKKELEKKVNKTKLVGDIVENWLKLAENRPTIVFASGVKHSIHLKEKFEKNGVIAAHLDAKSPHDERMEVLEKFRSGDITVVTNCQLFTEGYDADFVKCIVVARPTKSLPLWIQMAGRGQRIFEGKEDVLLLDHGGNIERHGFLTDKIIWSLDGKKKAWKKAVPKKKDKQPCKCTVCNFVFEGANTCPECNSPVKTFGKKIETEAGELKEVNGKKKKFSMAEKRVWYGQFKYYAMEKGYKDGWVSYKYKEKTGSWPRDLKTVEPIKPDQEFNNYITHLKIKYFKRKEKDGIK